MKSLPFAALILFATIRALPADNWPQYNGANSDRTTTEKIGQTNWGGSGPREVWKVKTNTGFSSFSVVGGRAYTIVRREVDGIDMEVCVALDADTGREVWAAPLGLLRWSHDGGNAGARNNKGGDGPRSTPSVVDGHVYTVNSDLGVHCLKAKDGKVVWKQDLMKDFDGRNIKWENAAAPLVEGDAVYVMGGGKGKSMVCFDKKSGKARWADHDYLMTHATPIAATIHGQRQIIFFTQQGLVSCDPKSGAQLWFHRFPFKVSTAASPVVYEDMVYCSAGYGVGATVIKLSKSGSKWSAKELWFSEGNKPVCNHWSTPVCKDGYLYGMFGFKEYGDGPVKCIDMTTGRVVWEEGGFGAGNVTLAGETLIALSDYGDVVLIKASPDKFQELGRKKAVGGKCWSTPVLANGRIYVRSTTEAACLDVGAKAASR